MKTKSHEIEPSRDSGAEALEFLLEYVGGVSELARRLNCRQSVVSNWRSRGQVSTNYMFELEELADYFITRHELRFDVYGAPPPNARRYFAGLRKALVTVRASGSSSPD